MLTALREDLELAKDLVPIAGEALARGRFVHHDVAFFLAATAARARQFPEAERLYRHCLAANLDPQLEVAVIDGLLRVSWELKHYEAIAQLCEHGLKQAAGTNRLLFHLNYARALASLDRVAEGLAEADRAVLAALDADARFVARTTRVRLLCYGHRYDQALAECQALLRESLQPGQLRDVRYLLSGIYSSQKEQARAEEQLQLILKEDANDATACNDLGYLWADQNRHLLESERLIRKAIELDREQKKSAGRDAETDNAAYLDSLGWVLYRRGNLAGSRQWLEKAATLPAGAEDPVVWDHLGDVYSQMGDAARAAAAWRRALDLYEKDPRRKADERVPVIRQKIQRGR